MGSLASRPKVPSYTASSPQVVYVSSPSTSATASAGATTSQSEAKRDTDTAQAASGITKEVRENNLLRRSRGRLSTVLTGFKGVLSDTTNSPTNSQRKSLLGE